VDGLVLEGVPVPGVPRLIRVPVGEPKAVVVPDPDHARLVADLAAGLAAPPPGTFVRVDGAVRLVPAEGGLLPYLTVLRNLMHGCRAAQRWIPRASAEEKARATAQWCGLEDVLYRYPHEITPGRRRLAGAARALAAGPAAIVLEDAAGLPTWGTLFDVAPDGDRPSVDPLPIAPDRDTGSPSRWHADVLSAGLLLIAPDRDRTLGFTVDSAGADDG
jgi:hypothetical protein